MSARLQPNIVLINCDDLGYGDLGCYDSAVNATPHIDRLAAEGMRFTDFCMASSVCSPSRAAMLTGCYPRRIGFGSFDGRMVLFPGQPLGMHPDEVTIATLLRRVGYATKLVGKWHCGDQRPFLPTRHGFDSYLGLPYSNDMGYRRDGDTYPPLPLLRDERVIQQQPDQAGLTERYVAESVSFMQENAHRPFFLYLAHMYVHLPLFVPARFMKQSRNGEYGAAVACIDWAMGVLMHELTRLGIADDTVVIFTSDNGSRCQHEGGSNGVLRGVKGSTWEGGFRVPCIVRWPGHVAAGAVCRELVTAMDLHPTLAEIAGAALPDDRIIDGRDILPLLRGDKGAASPHDAFFYYWMDNLEAVRDRRWKLHVRKRDTRMTALYDLHADPGETADVAERHPDIVADLTARLDACRDDLGDAAAPSPGRNVRAVGRVERGETLTRYDPDHPYMIAMYDLADRA